MKKKFATHGKQLEVKSDIDCSSPPRIFLTIHKRMEFSVKQPKVRIITNKRTRKGQFKIIKLLIEKGKTDANKIYLLSHV